MENAALCDYVRGQAAYLLGDRVARVQVELRDHDYLLGVGITLADGWRHAVALRTSEVRENPERCTEAACEALLAWLKVRAAGGTSVD